MTADDARISRRTVLEVAGGALATTAAAGTAAADERRTATSERGTGRQESSDSITFAQFNVFELTAEKAQSEDNEQLQAAAEVVQSAPDPDVLLINELDNNFQSGRQTDVHNAAAFLENYLNVPQRDDLNGVDFDHFYAPDSNTGVPSGIDVVKDGHDLEPGTRDYGNDSFGFGEYPGQYAMAIYSKHPIHADRIRTLREFRWQDLPEDRAPTEDRYDSGVYLTEAELERFRLSSKTHADVPIWIDGELVHAVISHPTPPVFDGDENLNGRRNYAEVKLVGDYVRGAEYVYDDQGNEGGLSEDTPFVVMGDMNAEPGGEDNYDTATENLIENPRILSEPLPESEGAAEVVGNPNATAEFEIQADYVLPSTEFDIVDSAVVWPAEGEPLRPVVETASDHRMVWVEAEFAPG
jgi:endonuclease/exonuclease/phosphatase family metal-dependent hydrolase